MNRTICLNSPSIKSYLELMIRERFPTENMTGAFAYGSAIFPNKFSDNQNTKNYDKRNMIDMVFIVDDPEKWHHQNLKQNSNDYSGINKLLGSKFITKFCNNSSPGILYNTLIKLSDKNFIKYGVISRDVLLDDLNNWRHLFIAGRLHKPVLWLNGVSNRVCMDTNDAVEANLNQAFAAAMLLNSNFKPEAMEKKVYYDICDLSYIGDVRRYFGIDSSKSRSIVDANIEHFRSLYLPIKQRVVTQLSSMHESKNNNKLARLYLVKSLPKIFVSKINSKLNISESNQLEVVEPTKLRQALKNSISDVVFRSSTIQAAKALITTEVSKTLLYSVQKITKAINAK